jgi:hypothetical protein
MDIELICIADCSSLSSRESIQSILNATQILNEAGEEMIEV